MQITNMSHSIKDILEPINTELEQVDVRIKEILSTGVSLLDDSAHHLFQKGGKKIRASLIILTSGLRGDFPDGVIDIAAAAEIIHAATLVHDDIIDKAFLRRGDITVSEKWGNKVAVLAGDFMYTTALEIAVNDENKKLFPFMVAGTKDMVKGELYQLQYSNLNSITREHYFRIVELKTAQFMGTCAALGALKSGNNEEVELLREFGLNLGYAFQIIDDTLDLVDDPSATGKDVGNDFEDGKITLPFLYILEGTDEERKTVIRDYINKPDDENWLIVKNLIREEGAIEYCMDVAGAYINRALGIINSFPDSENRNILIDITKFIGNRDY